MDFSNRSLKQEEKRCFNPLSARTRRALFRAKDPSARVGQVFMSSLRLGNGSRKVQSHSGARPILFSYLQQTPPPPPQERCRCRRETTHWVSRARGRSRAWPSGVPRAAAVEGGSLRRREPGGWPPASRRAAAAKEVAEARKQQQQQQQQQGEQGQVFPTSPRRRFALSLHAPLPPRPAGLSPLSWPWPPRRAPRAHDHRRGPGAWEPEQPFFKRGAH
jgi:hypothetical protein